MNILEKLQEEADKQIALMANFDVDVYLEANAKYQEKFVCIDGSLTKEEERELQQEIAEHVPTREAMKGLANDLKNVKQRYDKLMEAVVKDLKASEIPERASKCHEIQFVDCGYSENEFGIHFLNDKGEHIFKENYTNKFPVISSLLHFDTHDEVGGEIEAYFDNIDFWTVLEDFANAQKSLLWAKALQLVLDGDCKCRFRFITPNLDEILIY